uniref:Pleckstrin homology domain containing, family O member 1a n=1 Tax=Fundulus heteroclitus TaxID=8078 RepID=A0A3Q2UJG4_FUNHE
RMKKSNQSRRGIQDSGPLAAQQPEKAGWIRKFCGRGIFRELWRSRYVVLKGDHLYISDKEVSTRPRREDRRSCLNVCKIKFNVIFLQVPNLVFLAVSPEEKESWINTLNVAIIKAKNRVLDEVTIEEDSALDHLTRDRAKIPHSRRLPTRGHLMAVASTSSHGMLTLDLVAEEDGFCLDYDDDESWEDSFRVDLQKEGSGGGVGGRQRAGTDVSKLWVTPKEPKSRTPQPGKRFSMQGRSRCASMDEVLSSRCAATDQKCTFTQGRSSPGLSRSFDSALPRTPDKHRLSPPPLVPPEEDAEVERRRAEAERLLEEAVSSWKEAQEVLQEVKELQSQTLRRQSVLKSHICFEKLRKTVIHSCFRRDV